MSCLRGVRPVDKQNLFPFPLKGKIYSASQISCCFFSQNKVSLSEYLCCSMHNRILAKTGKHVDKFSNETTNLKYRKLNHARHVLRKVNLLRFHFICCSNRERIKNRLIIRKTTTPNHQRLGGFLVWLKKRPYLAVGTKRSKQNKKVTSPTSVCARQRCKV